MTLPAHITVIGAGSASFGENTLSALLGSKILEGSTLVLVDQNAQTLDTIKRLADRLNREWDAGFIIKACKNYKDALDTDTSFVISAIEIGAREGLWQKDFEIPLRFGVRQPYAENGGPGGFAHAARNIGPLLHIAQTMEQVCPQAWFVNFSNPMIRICDLINRYSRIKAVGLCHGIFIGYTMVGIALAKDLGIEVPEGLTGTQADPMLAPYQQRIREQIVPLVNIRAAGLNHFSWILSIHDQRTGEDLYPLFRKRFFELDRSFEPLTRRIFEVFDLFPVSGDTHLCEYLPWMSDQQTRPWEKYNLHLYDWELNAHLREFQHDRLNNMAEKKLPLDGLKQTDSEGALEVVQNLASANTHFHLAANLPNVGQITNLPLQATVETPVIIDGAGIHPVQMGSIPEPIAELLRRETTTAQLCVDAVVEGDRRKALQCLLLDPVITDMDTAVNVLDAYLLEYRDYLPQFWKNG